MTTFHITGASPLKQRGAILGVEYVLWFSVSLILSMVLVQVFAQIVADLSSLLSNALQNEQSSLGVGVNSATQQICQNGLGNGPQDPTMKLSAMKAPTGTGGGGSECSPFGQAQLIRDSLRGG